MIDQTPLTKKQKAVFDFMKEEKEKKGYPPSYEEIKEKFNFASGNTVACYMDQFKKKGYISSEYKKSRAITFLK